MGRNGTITKDNSLTLAKPGIGEKLMSVLAAEECEECGVSVIVSDGGVPTDDGVLCYGCMELYEESEMSGMVVYAGKGGPGYDIYIGRRMTRGGHNLPKSVWHNPFTIGKDGTREEVLEKFEHYIRAPEQSHLRARLGELEGKTLGCWCAGKSGIPAVLTAEEPHYCHGQILLQLIEEED